jgi:hypothetical protein
MEASRQALTESLEYGLMQYNTADQLETEQIG